METHCGRCGVGLMCDPAGDCWCKKLPHGRRPAAEDAAGCLCPECLVRQLVAEGLEVEDRDAKG
jgi:ribosomal protein L34E